MNREWLEIGRTDERGRDVEIATALANLDPASDDPRYWRSFRSWVMSGAARELARRRSAARLTVGDVVQSWARTVVPTALLAAAAASFLMLRGLAPVPMTVEEMLISEIEGETIPVMASPARTEEAVLFAAEAF